MNQLPEAIHLPGWPDQLTDTEDILYVLLRDGSPTGENMGNSCLYGRVDETTGYIERDRQWIPDLGATRRDMSFVPTPWTTADELTRLNLPTIVIPDEPVEPNEVIERERDDHT